MAEAESSSQQSAGGSRQGRPNRGWMWVFVVFFALGLTGMVVLYVVNVRMLLTPGDLAAARELWEQEGPRGYDLTYTKQFNHDKAETFEVHVRRGTVVSGSVDGDPLHEVNRANYDMAHLFQDMERFMENDKKPDAPRSYATGKFDSRDGHLERYVHSVRSTGERVEIVVTHFKDMTGK